MFPHDAAWQPVLPLARDRTSRLVGPAWSRDATAERNMTGSGRSECCFARVELVISARERACRPGRRAKLDPDRASLADAKPRYSIQRCTSERRMSRANAPRLVSPFTLAGDRGGASLLVAPRRRRSGPDRRILASGRRSPRRLVRARCRWQRRPGSRSASYVSTNRRGRVVRRCRASASWSYRARPRRWSGHPAPARRPRFSVCSASTTGRRARCGRTGSTCAPQTRPTCGRGSDRGAAQRPDRRVPRASQALGAWEATVSAHRGLGASRPAE